MKIFRRALPIAFAALIAARFSAGAELTIQAAASLTDVLKEVAADYSKTSADHLAFNFGASSMLARQIEEGAPADVFVSADEDKMDRLAQFGLLAPGTRVDLLSNTLVIIVAAEHGATVRAPEDLAGASIKMLALAEPSSVPAGIYAKQYLTKLGLWSRLQAKVVPTANVRAALAAVEAGNADAGIVYRTDALISKKVRIAVEIPLADGPRIEYPAAVLRDSAHPAEARRFLTYLRSPRARAIFRRAGFLVPD